MVIRALVHEIEGAACRYRRCGRPSGFFDVQSELSSIPYDGDHIIYASGNGLVPAKQRHDDARRSTVRPRTHIHTVPVIPVTFPPHRHQRRRPPPPARPARPPRPRPDEARPSIKALVATRWACITRSRNTITAFCSTGNGCNRLHINLSIR